MHDFSPAKSDAGAAGGGLLKVAVFGDSLSAGFGLDGGSGFSPALQKELDAANVPAKVVCAAVSGDTSADGLKRADGMLADIPDIVILEFGYNDLYYGKSADSVKNNLSALIARIKRAGARVLLAGTHAPAGVSAAERMRYAEIFEQLRDENNVPLYPFFLEGVLLNPFLHLPGDDIHPNAEGVRIVAKNIAPMAAQIAAEIKNARLAEGRA